MEESLLFTVPLEDVKLELRQGLIECQKRGLLQNAKWLSEMCYGLSDINIDNNNYHKTVPITPINPNDSQLQPSITATAMRNPNVSFIDQHLLGGIASEDYDNYFLAKSYFDLQEYDRAAYFVRNSNSAVPRFLHYYATYLSREKRRLDSTTDQSNLNDAENINDQAELMGILRSEYRNGRLDGYGMYLYGIILKSLNLNQLALQVLLQAVRLAPTLWGAYLEMSPLIVEKEKLQTLNLGGHWMRHFFIAHTYIELYLNDEGLKVYEELQNLGFKKCSYITSQMALAFHNKRDVDRAIEIFQEMQESDPYRLDNMDTYSNLLFVKELKTEMAQLAHKAVGINKYRPETCCVVGNYYSIRCEHQMAITYFQRALKLNPKYLAAWTLMGHEFMELKNTNAAIQSYRKAVEVNKRDYRAWYGLGQSYEILKMHYYSLYYFKIAHQLRPYDSRMLVALGETYEKLDKCENARKCYWKACDVGDIEGIAIYKLANLHEKLGDIETAVQCYTLYAQDDRATADKQSLYHAFITLANHFEEKGDLEKASHYAYKCLDSDDRKAEAKALLRTIENKRVTADVERPSTSTAATSKSTTIDSKSQRKIGNTSEEEDIDMECSNVSYLALPNELAIIKTSSSSSSSATTITTTNDVSIITPPQHENHLQINLSDLELARNLTNEYATTTSQTQLIRQVRTAQLSQPQLSSATSFHNADNSGNDMDISEISID